MELTSKRAHELLQLDRTTGYLYWKVARGGVKAGSRAGYLHANGYRYIGIDGKLHMEHKVVYLMIYGHFPSGTIDHIDRDKSNNCPTNLREVSHVRNMQNQSINSRNKSGFPGVYWRDRRKKWRARITIQGKELFLGEYTSALEAALARHAVEVQCPDWMYDKNSELVQAIQREWPGFLNHNI